MPGVGVSNRSYPSQKSLVGLEQEMQSQIFGRDSIESREDPVMKALISAASHALEEGLEATEVSPCDVENSYI